MFWNEEPEGSHWSRDLRSSEKPTREDPYKEVMSGDLVPWQAAVHPSTTKDDQLRRMEEFRDERAQHLERSFNSIFRRSLVFLLVGRFVSDRALARLVLLSGVRSAAVMGYVSGEQDLRLFVRRGPLGAAMLRITSGFAGRASVRISLRYTMRVVRGLIVDTMRASSNPPPLQKDDRDAASISGPPRWSASPGTTVHPRPDFVGTRHPLALCTFARCTP